MTSTVAGREEIGIGAGRRFSSIRFSLFSIVINRGCCSLIASSSLIVASFFGNVIGGDDKIGSHSN